MIYFFGGGQTCRCVSKVSLLEGQVGYSGVFCIYGAWLGDFQKGNRPQKNNKTYKGGARADR